MNLSARLLAIIFVAAACRCATASQADASTVRLTSQKAGPTPFISKLTLTASDLTVLKRVRFTIAPKPGSVTRPVSAVYTKEYLRQRGYVDAASGQFIVPVFGLYDGYSNSVTLKYFFGDGSTKEAETIITTAPFDDACDYNTPIVLQARTASTDLSYDFIMVTSACDKNSPTIIDTDGAVRWVGTAGVRKYTSTFYDNAIYQAQGPHLLRIELDGTTRLLADYSNLEVRGLHHNIDRGKHGLILGVNTKTWVESVLFEVDGAGKLLKQWVLGDIIRAAMIAGGDDPSGFVREAKGRYDFFAFQDWFHNNSATYRKEDDSLIISSRENFVICLDYETGAIKWILGDPNKQWYQYPSLRKYALEVAPAGHAPIGQHSVSMAKDGGLLLMDNGQQSQNHKPRGLHRGYTQPRKYELNPEAKIATEVWHYASDPLIFSPYCSSVYEDAPLNYLIDYAKGSLGRATIMGVTASGERVFGYSYPTFNCRDGYRSLPLHWENVVFRTR